MIKIKAYKTNLGLYINFCDMYSPNIEDFKFNGGIVYGTPKLNGNYFLLDDTFDITSLERRQAAKAVHVGYELHDPSLTSDKIPLTLSIDDVKLEWDDAAEMCLWTEYKSLEPLYKNVVEKLPEEFVSVEFELQVIGEFEITDYKNPIKMKVITKSNQGMLDKTPVEVDISSIVTYADIEKILTPEFLLHMRPCKISSEQVYKIVRAYVKENYDRKEVVITSDYDFCFIVDKIVHIEPHEVKKELLTTSGKSYKTPKFTTSVKSTKRVKIFEMTSAASKQKGYTVIDGWEADNLEKMAMQIKVYLDELITVINSPVTECTTCGGCGSIIKTVGTNER